MFVDNIIDSWNDWSWLKEREVGVLVCECRNVNDPVGPVWLPVLVEPDTSFDREACALFDIMIVLVELFVASWSDTTFCVVDLS